MARRSNAMLGSIQSGMARDLKLRSVPDRRGLRLVLALSMFIVLTGCGNPIRRKVERGIEQALPSIIGEAQSYQVRASGSMFRMLHGKFSAIRVIGKEVQLANGVRLADLAVNAKDIVFNTETQMLTKAGSAEYSATISQSELNRYLVKIYPNVPGLSVKLARGVMNIEAVPTLAGVAARIKAQGGLKVKDGRYLLLDLTDIEVVGLSTPAFAREYIETQVNPVFDAATFGYDARVSNIAIKQGALQVNGTLDLAKELNVER